MKRIIVIGCPGAGKSTFARELHNILKLDLYYLDQLFWNEDGSHVERNELIEKTSTVCDKDSWIIDGNYRATLEMRLQACDTVFFLDYPLEVCIDGIKARINKKRDDLPWIEKELDPAFLQYTKDFARDNMPTIKALLEKYKDKNIITFVNREMADKYLKYLQSGIVFETQDLILRKYVQSDYDDLFTILNDKENMSYYPSVYDEKGVQRWLDWNFSLYKDYNYGLWAIILKENNKMIGDCGITWQMINGQKLPEIGYHINKNYWRKGFGKQAARAVRDWVFTYHNFDALYSYLNAENIPSYKTASANGMHLVDQYNDGTEELKVMCITRQQWQELTRSK